MKRTLALLLVLCLIIGLFTGCGNNQGHVEEAFLDLLERPASEESISEISIFLDQNLSEIDKDFGSTMVLQYEDYILNYDNQAIDYNQWLEKYERYINKALTSLYHIKKLEQEVPIVSDGTIQVSWQELAQRAYEMEAYLAEFKEDQQIYDDAGWIYQNYISTMVMGTNSTPIFDYENFEFSEVAKEAYLAAIKEHPEGATTWALKEYFIYLESINYKMDYNDKVSSKRFFDTCTWLISEAGKRVFQ